MGMSWRAAYSSSFSREFRSPLPPRCDDPDVRVQRVGAEFKAYLVVTLPRGPVCDGIAAHFTGNFHQALGNQGARDRGAEQVFSLIDGIGPQHGKDEIAHELLAQVLDIDLPDPERLGLGPWRGTQFPRPGRCPR